MLIKIDHVCYTCARGSEKNIIESNPYYNVCFKEVNLENLDIKQVKSCCYNDIHDIIYMEAEGKIPIEITEYPTIAEGENRLAFDSATSTLVIPTDNLQQSIDFFQFCGAKISQQNSCRVQGSIKGLFDKTALNIDLVLTEQKTEWILDRGGICCLALVVKDVEKEREKWLERYEATEIRELDVNRKKLKIFFGFGKCGETIEVISL